MNIDKVTTGGYFDAMEQDDHKLRDISVRFTHSAEQPARLIPKGAREVSVKEAKAKLTELLRAAEAGERIVLTRHGKPVADLVPHAKVVEEKPTSLLERVHAWHEAHPGPSIGWVSPDFDEQLPEDFLLQPFPDDFDEKLAEHDQRVREAWAKFEAENPKPGRKK